MTSLLPHAKLTCKCTVFVVLLGKKHHTGPRRKPKLNSKNASLLQMLRFQLHQKTHSIQQLCFPDSFKLLVLSEFLVFTPSFWFFSVCYYFIMVPWKDWKWCPTFSQCFTPKFSYILRFSFGFDLGKQDFLINLPTYFSPNAFRIIVNENT